MKLKFNIVESDLILTKFPQESVFQTAQTTTMTNKLIRTKQPESKWLNPSLLTMPSSLLNREQSYIHKEYICIHICTHTHTHTHKYLPKTGSCHDANFLSSLAAPHWCYQWQQSYKHSDSRFSVYIRLSHLEIQYLHDIVLFCSAFFILWLSWIHSIRSQVWTPLPLKNTNQLRQKTDTKIAK